MKTQQKINNIEILKENQGKRDGEYEFKIIILGDQLRKSCTQGVAFAKEDQRKNIRAKIIDDFPEPKNAYLQIESYH